MYSPFFKNRNTLFLICALAIVSVSNAQEVRVIDNKGTIETVRNNQVTTADTPPLDPLENDVWFDTDTDILDNVITNIWNGTAWVIVGGVSTDADNALTAGTDSGAYKALRVIDVYNGGGDPDNPQEIPNNGTQLIIDTERINVGFATVSTGDDEVIIPEDGIYKVTYTASFRTKETHGTRTTARVELQINDSREDGTDSYSYHRQNNGSNNSASNVSTSTAGRSIIRIFSENDKISLFAIRFEGPAARRFHALAEGTGITIQKLN